jgi:hypothetical protein
MARAVTILDLTGTTVDIGQSGGLRLHLAANVVYKAHCIVFEALIAGEIRLSEY